MFSMPLLSVTEDDGQPLHAPCKQDSTAHPRPAQHRHKLVDCSTDHLVHQLPSFSPSLLMVMHMYMMPVQHKRTGLHCHQRGHHHCTCLSPIARPHHHLECDCACVMVKALVHDVAAVLLHGRPDARLQQLLDHGNDLHAAWEAACGSRQAGGIQPPSSLLHCPC